MPRAIATMCGSLRAGSYNRMLLREFEARSAGRFAVTEVPIGEFPHFNQDLEANAPEAVVEAKRVIAGAECLLLVSPEHNYGVPSVLKNAVEWVSRPFGDPTLVGRPMAVMGASTGKIGTVRAQIAWRSSWYFFKAPVFSRVELLVANASHVFDDSGALVDDQTGQMLDAYIDALDAWLVDIARARGL